MVDNLLITNRKAYQQTMCLLEDLGFVVNTDIHALIVICNYGLNLEGGAHAPCAPNLNPSM